MPLYLRGNEWIDTITTTNDVFPFHWLSLLFLSNSRSSFICCVCFFVVWFTSYFSAGFASIYIRMGNGSETAILPAIVVVVVRHCLAESSTVTARRKNMSGPVGKMQCAAATALDIPDISHARTKTKSYAAFSIKLYFFVFKCTVWGFYFFKVHSFISREMFRHWYNLKGSFHTHTDWIERCITRDSHAEFRILYA